MDNLGKVYIADTGNHLIRQVDSARQSSLPLPECEMRPSIPVTVAANQGPRAGSRLAHPPEPHPRCEDQRNLYVADTGNHLVRRILLNNVIEDTLITTEAGSVDGSAGYDGEDRNAIVSSLDSPSAVAVNSLGEVYIADTGNQRVRAIVSAGERRPKILITVAGNGESSFSGERTPATNATLHFPSDVALDSDGNIYFSDTGNHRVRRVDLSTGLITTVAGNGVAGSRGVGGRGTDTRLHSPEGLAFDSEGRLYIADTENDRVLRLNLNSGIIHALVEVGSPSSNSTSTVATFNSPTALTIDSSDNLYIAETENHRISMINLDAGGISTVAGDDSEGFAGDGQQATRAKLNQPEGVAVDAEGNIFIADTGNRRIRRVDFGTGIISTIAGDGRRGYAGDGSPAIEASLVVPEGSPSTPRATS